MIIKHPEFKRMLNVVLTEEKNWKTRYGNPYRGSLETLEVVDNMKDICDDVRHIKVELLNELLRVCRENDLVAYLMYGSLLGAVRGDGFVDNDDDIDVALTREDYNKLCALSDCFNKKFFLQTPYNDDAFYGGYLKLRNKTTTELSAYNWWTNACEGICIDIFPIDAGYGNALKESIKHKFITILQRLLYAKCYGYTRAFLDMKMLKWKSYKYVGKIISKDKLAYLLDKILASHDELPGRKFGIYTHYSPKGSARYFNEEAFKEKIVMRFEGIEIDAPYGWDDVLADLYGAGYYDIVSKEKNKRYHGFYNPYEPYDNYKKRFSGLLRPIPQTTRSIVLFGNPEIFELFDLINSGKVNVAKRITMDMIETYSGSDSDTYAIICAFDVRNVENILRNLGYRDYYFFWFDKNWIHYDENGIKQQYKDLKEKGII